MKKNYIYALGFILLACLGGCSPRANSNNQTQEMTNVEETKSVVVEKAETTKQGVVEASVENSNENKAPEKITEEYIVGDAKSLLARTSDFFNPFIYQEDRNDWEGDFAQRNHYALEEGYQFIGKAYFNDFNKEVREAYLPYGGVINLLEGLVSGGNHGIYVVSSAVPSPDAITTAKELRAAMLEAGFPMKIGEIIEGEQVAYFPFYYEENYEGVDYGHFGIRYCSTISDGVDHFSELIFTPQKFDESSDKLISELESIYQLDFDIVKDGVEIKWLNFSK